MLIAAACANIRKQDATETSLPRRGLHRAFARAMLRTAVSKVHQDLRIWSTKGYEPRPLRHPRLLRPLEALARFYLRTSVRDRALRRALTPDYRLGGRRLITSGTYSAALTRPNVRLHPTRVTAVEGSDVIGADGTRTRADIIVLATGFRIGDLPLAPQLHGIDGTLAQTWADSRRAYLGTSVSGYPNPFLLIGPNLLTGTTAVPTILEAQLRSITTALNHLRTSRASALDVKPEAARQQALHEALRNTVYNTTGGTAYYFGLPGINTFCWPWSTAGLVKRLHSFDPDVYTWRLPLPTQAGAERDGLPAHRSG
ncbi:hypothetical protein [Streptomyces lanatus]|uniref:Cyclohexanone monooxygenase n=1 Tax=Streptomyces lanatus TaxID=66900 RepID=A0ABV1Y5V3_9ACTN|nr:hypothetical protein [Streptomyces lanatus]GHH29506.1 hypothetical protein GCM10018780_87640 [Streptomyces lanatus]